MDGRDLLLRGLSIDWDRIPGDSYLRAIGALRDLEGLTFHRPVTCFAGENGSGKSTLLEAIAEAYGFNPEGGTRNYRFSTYDAKSPLSGAVRLSRGAFRARWGYFLRAESFYNVATAEEEYARYGGIPREYHRQSHGESFLAAARDNFRANGLYLLDEPEAALSARSQLAMLAEIVRCAGENAQFIIATHSPILLGTPGAEIWSFDDGPVHPIAYEDAESLRITEMFLRDRDRLLKRLLEED